MNILGISAFYHDSAAALIVDGNLIAAAQEERFSRKKNDPSFPIESIRFCLKHAGITLSEIDTVAFYDKPFLKFERLLETYLAFAPKGIVSFIRSMPVWLKEKLFIKQTIRNELKKAGAYDKKKLKLLFSEHHLSHAASAYYSSPFTDAAILTIDAVGEWATASISHGTGNSITIHKQLDFPHSVGLLYSAFTYYCGFKVNSGEYKLMGLAPYGHRQSTACRQMIEIIKTKLVEIHDDGSVFLHQEYFTYATGLRMVNDKKWKQLFGFEKRAPDSPLLQQYCDMALAIQTVLEEIILKMAAETKRITGSSNLCMAGGVALNCVANTALLRSNLFSDIFIQPAAGDAGGAIGAAYAACHIYYKTPIPVVPDEINRVYLGPENDEVHINLMCQRYKAVGMVYQDEELYRIVANLLDKGNVVGWCQGRMEFGPRALGARSILADPRKGDMQNILNQKIKFREDFRPFAPVVLVEDCSDYFEDIKSSPYMLFVYNVKTAWQPMLPAITHKDGTSRVQTVEENSNPGLYRLLRAFKMITGISVLINTSFNVREEPIVNTADDAYRCFMCTGMDYLVLGNHVFDKHLQPPFNEMYNKLNSESD